MHGYLKRTTGIVGHSGVGGRQQVYRLFGELCFLHAVNFSLPAKVEVQFIRIASTYISQATNTSSESISPSWKLRHVLSDTKF